MDTCTGAFFVKADLILVFSICDAEDMPFLVSSIHLRDEQFVKLKLVPYFLAVYLLEDCDALRVAGKEARVPSSKGLLLPHGGLLI